ncbi:hypothetical protein F4802DRAFT_553001 [Xylaria palmicola]|nr:hypothetical protein F4802DRAFT_553001 [Xylaria palmicola]
MFRTRVSPRRLAASASRPPSRPYATYHILLPRVRLLAPALWSFAACGTIYLGCAAYEVYQDVRGAGAGASSWTRQKSPQTFQELERLSESERARRMARRARARERPEMERPEARLTDARKLALGTMCLTAGIHLVSLVEPRVRLHITHVPMLSRHYTLLTSVFGHGGWVHLGMNLWAMNILLPYAGSTPVFNDSAPHLAAFYASAGVLSSLAHHATARWAPRFNAPALGASGALFALFGVFGVSSPDARAGILFLPGSVSMADAIAYLAIFEAVGVCIRYPLLRFAHGAHLSGLALGVAYAKYGGDKKIWRPGRRVAFSVMRSLRLL